jgi:UDP-glucose 4-epimerase
MVKFLKKNSIILTGSSGYVGSATKELLEKLNYEVFCIDKAIKKDTRNIFRIALFAFKKPKALVHLSSKKSIPESIKSPYSYYFNNILSTLCVAIISKVFRLPVVFASSAAVYEPYNPYAKSKLVEEKILKVFCSRLVVLRYFNLVGKSSVAQDKNGTNIFSIINSNSSIKVNNPKSTRDYVNILDIAKANVMAINYAQNNNFLLTDIFTGIQKTMLEVIEEYNACGIKIDYKILDMPDLTVFPKVDNRDLLGWYPDISFSESIKSETLYK